jgi:RNA polymerase sigma-70 factor (ECF subfamily)
VSFEELTATHHPETVDSAPDPAARAVLREEQRIAEEGLRSLSQKERTALVLRDVEGLTTRQVAEVLGSAETTVRSHICRARLKIREFRERRRRSLS